jgi:O-acetylhomoserine (thiol)-lyase
VTYAGLPSSPCFDRVARICPKGAGGLFTFALKGGYDACVKLVDSPRICSAMSPTLAIRGR